jgi:ribosomal protein S27E
MSVDIKKLEAKAAAMAGRHCPACGHEATFYVWSSRRVICSQCQATVDPRDVMDPDNDPEPDDDSP